MDNGDKPASPLVNLEDWRDIESVFNEHSELMGLTKRERFAMAAMQGILSNPSIDELETKEVAHGAKLYADALLKALEGE